MTLLSVNINQQDHNDTTFQLGNYKDGLMQATNGLMLVLALMAFFIQPFYILILVSILQIYINFKPAYFLPVFSAALALYWSNRHIGVAWDGGFDDAVGYVETFLLMHKGDIGILFANFFSQPAGNEIAYSFFVYTIRFFTSEQQVFLFFVYFTMLSLLSVATININRRYCLVIVSVIFFGVGGFVEQAALHLFRATLASLILLVALSLYEKKRKQSYWLMIISCLVHVAVIPLVFLFLVTQYVKAIKNRLILLVVCFLIVFFLKYLAGFIDISLIDAARAAYINEDAVVSYSEPFLLGGILLIHYLLHKNAMHSIYLYSFFITGMLFFVYITMKEYTFIAGRYLYLIQLFAGLLVFQIIMKVSIKPIICFLLVTLFIRKMIVLNNSDFIKGAFDNFSDFFSPITFFF